jgi:CubicO group peptidase (beta-lactamase class C family)
MSNGQSTLQQIITELARFPLAFQPGSRWHYSMSIDVLAHLIEVISNQSLQSFLKHRFFDPLGMPDTAFEVPDSKKHRLATMYGHPDVASNTFSNILNAWSEGKRGQVNVEETYPANSPNFARGGHGLFSTATDYLRFAQMLLNRGKLDGVRLLSPKIVDFMHMNHVSPKLLPCEIAGIPRLGYGFGLGSRVRLNVAEAGVPGSIGEYGWAGAARTYYWVDPQEELIGVMMTQFMMAVDFLDRDFQVLAYQAMLD